MAIQPRHARAADEVLSLLAKSGASTQLSPEDWAAFRDLCAEVRETATPKTVVAPAEIGARPAAERATVEELCQHLERYADRTFVEQDDKTRVALPNLPT